MRRSWIKIETNTPDKPEICIIASQLRLDEDAVMGKLIRFWAWAEFNVTKNNETIVTSTFLDKLVGKKGFTTALELAGWLKRDGDRIILPNFERHNGQAAKGRAQTALRVSRHRARKANESEGVTNKSIQESQESESKSNQNSPIAKGVNNQHNQLETSEQKSDNNIANDIKFVTQASQTHHDSESLESPINIVIDDTPEATQTSEGPAPKRKGSRASKLVNATEQPLLF